MAKNVLLTNPKFIKEITNIDDNVQDKFLFPAINESQEIDLKSIIGENLLKRLKEMVLDESINRPGNEAYKDLVEKSQFFLAYSVLSKLVVTTSFKLDNAGLYRSNDENLYYASMDEVKNMEEYYQNRAAFFKLELQNFIINNKSAFAELSECACRQIGANLYSAENCGLWLGGARGKGYKGRKYN